MPLGAHDHSPVLPVIGSGQHRLCTGMFLGVALVREAAAVLAIGTSRAKAGASDIYHCARAGTVMSHSCHVTASGTAEVLRIGPATEGGTVTCCDVCRWCASSDTLWRNGAGRGS